MLWEIFKEIWKLPALEAGSFSVLGGGAAHLFPEGLCEIAHILKTAADGNVRYFFSGFCQQFCGLLDTVLLQVLDGSGSDGLTKTPQTLTFTDRGAGSDGSSSEF